MSHFIYFYVVLPDTRRTTLVSEIYPIYEKLGKSYHGCVWMADLETGETTSEQAETLTQTTKRFRRNRFLHMSRIELRSKASSIVPQANRCCKQLRLGCMLRGAVETTGTSEARSYNSKTSTPTSRGGTVHCHGTERTEALRSRITFRAQYVIRSKQDDHETCELDPIHNLMG